MDPILTTASSEITGRPQTSSAKKVPMPWLKLWGITYLNPDIAAMKLEQQAVFFRLLCHASMQDPPGGFDTSNLRKLARYVAGDNEHLLKETLDYLLNDSGTLESVNEGWTRFTKWGEYQASQKSPSDEPEQTRERQRKSREKKKAEADPNSTTVPSTSGLNDGVTSGHERHETEEEGEEDEQGYEYSEEVTEEDEQGYEYSEAIEEGER